MMKDIFKNFFVQRFSELFHKDTIDSYSVRAHNALTLLHEFREVLDDWQNFNLKNIDDVRLCADELRAALTNDKCLTYKDCSKTVFLSLFDECLKNCKEDKDRSAFKKVIYCIDKIIEENDAQYLKNLFNEIENYVFKDNHDGEFPIVDLITLDSLISSLASQLIYIGYSKYYLYRLVSDIDAYNFNDKYYPFKEKLCNPKKSLKHVIFKLYVTSKNSYIQKTLGLHDEIPEKYTSAPIKKKYKAYHEAGSYYKYFIYEIETALDSFSVIEQAREELARKLDLFHLSNNLLNIEIPTKALVTYLNADGTMQYDYHQKYYVDGVYDNKDPQLVDSIYKLMNNKRIDNDVKERLSSALRHLRLGSCQSEIEQQFINYWIALEFIFSSPEAKDTTFSRLKTNMVNILTVCYLKRNIAYIGKTVKTDWIIDDIVDNAVLDGLLNAELSELSQYRLRTIKPVIQGNSDKRKEYICNHEHILQQHIARIYRLRNKLIHEGAIKNDIGIITKHLRYYLVFIINQMINYYTEKNGSMDNMFFEYDLLLRRIKESYDLKILMSVPLEAILI